MTYFNQNQDFSNASKEDNYLFTLFINRLLKDGKKKVARKIFFNVLNLIEFKTKKSSILIIEKAIRNCIPSVQLKSRRIGGVTHQVPTFLTQLQAIKLAIRWLIQSTTKNTGKSIVIKLTNEIIEASKGLGSVVKKKEEIHKMAEANKTFLQID